MTEKYEGLVQAVKVARDTFSKMQEGQASKGNKLKAPADFGFKPSVEEQTFEGLSTKVIERLQTTTNSDASTWYFDRCLMTAINCLFDEKLTGEQLKDFDNNYQRFSDVVSINSNLVFSLLSKLQHFRYISLIR